MASATATRPARGRSLIPLALLAALTLAIFGDLLFTGTPVVLSNRDTDLAGQFLDWRWFGFGELRRGNLALWNPHLFSGAPHFGGFQPALLYPLNALFLVLPLPQAINWTIALHVFLAGAFTYAWAARRGLRPPACTLAAVMFMLGGAHFLHIYAGHLSNLCTMVWAPLLFLAIDALSEEPSLRWTLLGMFAVAMQVLAGHPQYVFYTALAAAMYSLLCAWSATRRGRFLAGLAGIVLGGVALSAVQLLTGWQESRETLRSVGLSYEFAGMFSFPPENFLTLVAPQLLGDMKTVPYWGRCYLWEMSLFMGVSGLVLGLLGIVRGERRARTSSLAMIAVLVLLALGSRTPLFDVLYEWLPGFNRFRGHSKAMFLASLFFAMLAASGFDALINGRRPPRVFVAGTAIAGLLLALAAWSVHQSSAAPVTESRWHSLMLAVRESGESYVSPGAYDDPAVARQAGGMAARSLLIGGGTMALMALVLLCIRSDRRAIWVLPGLVLVELFVFARSSLDTFDPAPTAPAEVQQYLDEHPGDYRILNLGEPNSALRSGAQDIWGDDPGATLRYAQLVALMQNVPPDLVTQYLRPSGDHQLLGMLRCRAIFPGPGSHAPVYERADYLPHVLVVPRHRVLNGRDQIFAALTSAAFDPRQEVILEAPPELPPATSGAPGTAMIVDSSTDHLTIEADAPSPGILVIADAYATGWRARALDGSSQQHYRVMPANYCLRAIPLAAGKHRLRLEYVPSGFVAGSWISAIALAIFASLVAGHCWQRCACGRITIAGTR